MGGSGRRLTKDAFLKEIQDLDPKARCEIVQESDAPLEMKAMAKQDASKDSPGSSRLFEAKAGQAASGKDTAKSVGAEMAKRRGANIEEGEEDRENGDERGRKSGVKGIVGLVKGKNPKHAPTSTHPHNSSTSNSQSPANDEPETAVEKKRREQAMRGIDDVTDAQRGRSHSRSTSRSRGGRPRKSVDFETAAEKRRREAALGLGGNARDGEEDSDDDGAPRVPPPVAMGRSRGIRFAQSPVRGKR